MHWVKNVRNRSYFRPYYPAFELHTERYGVSLPIQSECRIIRTRITPNTDIFYAVMNISIAGNIFMHGYIHSMWSRTLVLRLKKSFKFQSFNKTNPPTQKYRNRALWEIQIIKSHRNDEGAHLLKFKTSGCIF